MKKDKNPVPGTVVLNPSQFKTNKDGVILIRPGYDYVTCPNVKCNIVVKAFKGDMCPGCRRPL